MMLEKTLPRDKTDLKTKSMCTRPELIYKYGKADNILKCLKGCYLWSSLPEEFDDPYDSKITLDFSGCISNTQKEIQEINARRMNRIISFSAKADDPILWYYYANKYDGIVLCFNNCSIDKSPFALMLEEYNFNPSHPRYNELKNRFPLVEVKYVEKEKRPKEYNPLSDTDAVLEAQLRTKHDSWKFEKEYRAILPMSLLAKPYQREIKYRKEALNSVIVGLNTPQVTIDAIKNTLQEDYGSNPKIHKIQEVRTSYGFKLEEITY